MSTSIVKTETQHGQVTKATVNFVRLGIAANGTPLGEVPELFILKLRYMDAQMALNELKQKVEKLPKEANWFGNVDNIRLLIKELEQAFCQANVKRWLDFEKQPPIDEQFVAYRTKDGDYGMAVYLAEKPFMWRHWVQWYPLPAIA